MKHQRSRLTVTAADWQWLPRPDGILSSFPSKPGLPRAFITARRDGNILSCCKTLREKGSSVLNPASCEWQRSGAAVVPTVLEHRRDIKIMHLLSLCLNHSYRDQRRASNVLFWWNTFCCFNHLRNKTKFKQVTSIETSKYLWACLHLFKHCTVASQHAHSVHLSIFSFKIKSWDVTIHSCESLNLFRLSWTCSGSLMCWVCEKATRGWGRNNETVWGTASRLGLMALDKAGEEGVHVLQSQWVASWRMMKRSKQRKSEQLAACFQPIKRWRVDVLKPPFYQPWLLYECHEYALALAPRVVTLQ